MFSHTKNNDPISTSENVPVYTMKKDLENLKNPQPANQNTGFVSKIEEKIPKSASLAGKPNPFLSSKSWNEQKEIIKKEEIQLEENDKGGGIGKAIFIGIIIFVILIVGAGGYYFWFTKINANKLPVKTLSSLNADKPNYLSFDIDNSDSLKIKEIIKNYAQKVSALNSDSAIEFIITDTQNNSVNFQKFSQIMKITLPESITSLLETEFSLYIYNENGKARIGLSIPFLNESALKTALLAEEPNLPKYLEAVFLATFYTLNDNYTFSSSTYGQSQIKYVNIASSESLSVDYSLYNNQLLIGTTKTTLRKMIDYIDQQAKIIQ